MRLGRRSLGARDVDWSCGTSGGGILFFFVAMTFLAEAAVGWAIYNEPSAIISMTICFR